MDAPTTLQQAIIYFSDAEHCNAFMIAQRWPDGQVCCPQCDSSNVKYLPNAKVWKCYEKHDRQKFSLKVGTIFEDSPLPLQKWLPAVWLIANCKNGISSYELARALGVTQKTAWFMLHRIRLAMQTKSFGIPMSGEVEVDETFIGGKARNMHKGRRDRMLKGRQSGWTGKIAVMGLLERHGVDGHSVVRTEVIKTNDRRNVQYQIRQHVKTDGQTTVYSDALKSYEPKTPKGWRPSDLYAHKVIDHAEKYVDGQIHTNGMENFWSLLKRALRGTYVSVEPFHLFRYLDEQAYRFNNRKTDDGERFRGVLASIGNRRLMYRDLIGEKHAEA